MTCAHDEASLTPPAALDTVFDRYVKDWTAIGLSTAPADRPVAEAAMWGLYREVGMKPPEMIWCASPRALVFQRLYIAASEAHGSRLVDSERIVRLLRNRRQGQTATAIWAGLYSRMSAEQVDIIADMIGGRIEQPLDVAIQKNVRTPVNTVVKAILESARPANAIFSGVMWGNQEISVAPGLYYRDEFGMVQETEPLSPLIQLARSAGWVIPCASMCLLCDRPEVIHLDADGRLHNADGPAIRWRDGFSVYALHGQGVTA